MHQYLVVSNQTLESEQLADKVRACLAAGPCQFHVLVPATHPRDHYFWTEGSDRVIARTRLAAALERMRVLGAVADGEVGDASPLQAIQDVLTRGLHVDEIILVTLPPGPSRWLRQDLVHRLTRTVNIPLTHLIAEPVKLQSVS